MKNKFKHIVVPTDFSDTAQTALSLAAEFAGWYRAEIDLVNAVDATVYAYAGYPFASLSQELVSGAEEALQKLKLPAAAKDVAIHRYILSGNPANEILAHARRSGADLIVIGTQGRGPVARMILGSVADRVLSEATCPVIVTKAPKGTVKHPRSKRKPLARILFPTDFSDTARKALDRAIALTEDMDAELHVVHVVDDTLISTHVEQERAVILKDLRRHALDQMRNEMPAELLQNFETIAAVKRGDPGKQIAAYAETHGCDMIVMGSHGRTGVGRLLLGSVADKVVRRAKCPVFIERA